MHTSIKLNTPCELINVTPLNPMISKVQIKVCYVGDEPNRNGSIITKETAAKMANSLPGSPIVGFWKEEKADFDEHNQVINISGGSWEISDLTRPYGFVDLGAKVWFQDYMDGENIHTYMVTEGYIWTGRYPETNRILSKGNNQSMELDEETLQGHWTIDDKSGMEFFIINDAIFRGLCILGEDNEPCFEGSQITGSFSLDESFDSKIYKLMKEVQKLKGGNFTVDLEKVNAPEEEIIDSQEEEKEEEVIEETVEEDTTESTPGEEVEEEEEPAAEEEEEKVEEPAPEEEVAEEEESTEEEEEEKLEETEDETAQFSLIDFQNLQESYSNLETQFNELQRKFEDMSTSYAQLVEFKETKDREEKQKMIDSFYMLSDSDKQDVQDNIDQYSLDEIEAKLSIICVHNKLDLSGKADDENNPDTTFSLEDVDDDSEDTNIPALVSALRKNRKSDK
jgi:hypothetical protein